jgi:hypothetical protein
VIDVATSAMKAKPLMKATIKIYDLLINNGGSFVKRMAMTFFFANIATFSIVVMVKGKTFYQRN